MRSDRRLVFTALGLALAVTVRRVERSWPIERVGGQRFEFRVPDLPVRIDPIDPDDPVEDGDR